MVRPSILGGAYVVALVLAAAGEQGGNERALGREAETLARAVMNRLGSEVLRFELALLGLAFLLGALLGVVAAGIVRLRDHLARGEPRSERSVAWRSLPVTAALHAFIFAHAMAQQPALYADRWYAHGGLPRTVQVLTTDVLHPSGVIALGLGVLLLYILGARATRRSLPRRLRRALGLGGLSAFAVARAGSAVVPEGAAPEPSASPPPPSSPSPSPSSASRSANAGRRAGDPRPNVLVLAVDSLRADHLEPRVAPHLSALAARGTRFERAYVSLPRTFPSWTTLLTGRYPQHHGIRSMFPRFEERARDLDALPARLTDAGYSTAVTSDYAGDIFGRIDLGFARAVVPRFDLPTLARERALERETPLFPFLVTPLGRATFPALRASNTAADPELLASDAVHLLGELAAGPDPFFLTVFFSTVHFPYAAPDPWERAFTQASYRGRFKYDKPVSLGGGQREGDRSDGTADAEDEAQLRGLYDGAVASVDAAAARVLAALHDLGREGDTVIVVTADHGETLYDGGHGEGHGDHLFGDEAVHVPLAIVDPRRPVGHVEPALVRDVDLAPTLYALTGVEPPADLDGRSLVAALDGAGVPPSLAFAETGLWFTRDIAGLSPSLRLPYPAIGELLEADDAHGGQLVLASRFTALTRLAKHRMVRDERWKLLYLPTREGAVYQLFDTLADPLELRDVAAEHPDQVARLRTELLHWMLADEATTLQGGLVVPREDTPR